ncbi:polymorphic toxin-type HINT domain-containing protein [Cohnella sp. GCM10020058]|uniref:polymorphic toxin-type HINT domain-containing protein n=1 Tax=Cohnella sp. GCM10020058 TaxID=3317330 RepID=UPI003634BF96
MKSTFSKILASLVIGSLLATSWPAGTSLAKTGDTVQTEKAKAKKLNDKRTEIAGKFGKTEDDIQSLLNQGYTSDEVSGALARQKSETLSLTTALGKARKLNLNRSKDKSEIETEVGKNILENPKNTMMAASSTAPANPVSDVTLKNLNLKLDNAPFAVSNDQESISPLDGSLSTTNTDFVLPGRNGLSFSLTRNYSTSDSQYFEISQSYYNDKILYDVMFNATVKQYRLLFTPMFQMTHTRDYTDCTGSVLVNEWISTDYWALTAKSAKYNEALSLASSLQTTQPSYVGDYSACTNNVKKRDKYYFVLGSASVIQAGEELIGTSHANNLLYDKYETEAAANQAKQTELAPYVGSTAYLEDDPEGTDATQYTFNRYYVDSGASSTFVAQEAAGNWHAYNSAGKTYSDLHSPLGKGWSWDVPYVKEGKFVHLSGGSYEVNGTQLKGYPFDDISFAAQNGTVTVNQASQSYSYVVSNLSGIKQYFNAEGQIIKMTDAYDNYIDFGYTYSATYGQNLLTSITDPLNNKIQIQYTTAEVTLTYGDRTVKLTKASIQNNGSTIELLDRVTDPMNRVTRYEYKQATDTRYNVINNNVAGGIANGYALLKTVYYPTGAETHYTYESTPVTRYLSTTAVNQAYRVQSREDHIVTVNPDTQAPTFVPNNRVNFTYTGDIQSSYGNDMTFSSVVDTILGQTTYTYDKDFIDDSNPEVYYTTQIKQSQGGLDTTTSQVYDRTRKLTMPNSSTTVFKNTQSGATRTVTTSQVYDNSGNVTSQTNEQNITTQYTYFPGTHLVQTILQPTAANKSLYTVVTKTAKNDPDVVKVTENNASGALLQMSDYDYDSYGNVTRIVTKKDAQDLSKENIVILEYSGTYNNAYLTRQQIDGKDVNSTAFTVTTQAEYNRATGQMTRFVDGNQKGTDYEYDKLGRIKKITNPELKSVQIQYNDSTNVVTQTNEASAKIESRFDPLGRMTQQGIYSNGVYMAKQKNIYDAYGRIKSVEDAEGNLTKYDYQLLPSGTKVAETSPAPDNSQSYTQTDVVNLIQTTGDGLGNLVSNTLDVMGNTVKTQTTNISTEVPAKPTVVNTENMTYDYSGHMLTYKDAKTQTTQYGYDGLGRLTSVTNPLNEVTSYRYNLVGSLESIQYPDQTTTTKTYDTLGRVLKSTKSDGTEEKFVYDGNSNVLAYTDESGKVFNSTFNFRNQLLTQSDGQNTTQFTYTDDGLRKTMADTIGTTIYTYDPYSRLNDQVTYPDQKVLTYEHDSRGNVKKLTGPFGDVVSYKYDTSNRLKLINDGVDSEYGYYSNGSLKSIVQGNGVTANYFYSGLVLTALNYSGANLSPVQYRYSYDANNNIETVSKNGAVQSYAYDALNRVKTSSQNNEVYTYDSRGNRSTLQTDALPDDLGDNPLLGYQYDAFNQLTAATNDEEAGVTYRYNGDGLMVERTENGERTRYYYDVNNEIIAEGKVNANGSVTKIASYARGVGLSYQTNGSGIKSYYMTNGHGDTEYMTDATGHIVNSYTYDLWGKPTQLNAQVANPFLYAGEYWDSTTKLQYLRARWYDPSVGRFMNEDSVEGQLNNPLTLNQYTYAANNPLIYVDPSGNVYKWVGDGWRLIKKGVVAVANFLVVDDIRTILDPNASTFDKALAAASFIPVGKVIKGGKLVVKLVNKEGKVVERAVENSASNRKLADKVLGACNCFVAGTKVQTDEGEKNIEDIQVGDRVLSKDEATGEVAYKEVTATFNHETDEIYNIQVGAQTIESTFNHPFYVDGKGWTFVKDLQAGDLLVQSDGHTLKIDSIELEQKHVTVYNMTVDEFHTYFVSDLGIWVHNSECLKGGIKHSLYRDLRDKFGEKGRERFVEAMNKGIVRSQGENGVKFVGSSHNGKGVLFGNTYYKYEVKLVGGPEGDWRLLGNWDEKQNQVLYTVMANHKRIKY